MSDRMHTRPRNMAYQRRCGGFGLIETAISVAVVGIVAVIAIPKYNDIVLRAEVAKAVTLHLEALHQMTAYHEIHDEFVTNYKNLDRRNADVGLKPGSAYENGFVNDFWVGSTGIPGKDATTAHIAMEFEPNDKLTDAGTPRLLSTIEFINGEYIFKCNDPDSNWANQFVNIHDKYLPKMCRHS